MFLRTTLVVFLFDVAVPKRSAFTTMCATVIVLLGKYVWLLKELLALISIFWEELLLSTLFRLERIMDKLAYFNIVGHHSHNPMILCLAYL